jgi:succinyl-diaminopimelate desuccinylase
LSLPDTLLWLCRVPSPIGEERELCDRVIERLSAVELAAPIRRYGDSCVVPLTRGTGGPHVILAGHLDVVRTEHEGPPRIEGERLYAPGAADMKSGLSLMIELAERGERPRADVTLVFYAREEGPYAENELGPVLEQDPELKSADVAIALEPSDNKLQLGCGGSIHARVRFRGKTAHSARPWQGENAIHKAAGLLERLSARAPVSQVVDGLEWKNVVSATVASGGRGRNIIPDGFELNLNQRFGPGTSVEQAKAEIWELVAGEAEVEFVDVSPSAPPHRSHPLVAALAESGVLAIEPKQAWTDVARFSALGIPAVNFGPGVQAQAHQKNEWTSLPALEVGRRVLCTWLSKIAAGSLPVLALSLALAQVGCQSSGSRQERARADAVAGREEPNLLERSRLSPALSEVARRFDPKTRVLEIDIDTRRCVIQAEDPTQKGRLLEYQYEQGRFGEPRLVELRGSGDLDENLFPLGAVRLSALPDLLGAAVEKVDSHDGRATRILVRRNLPDSEDVRVRVFVDSPRRSGHLDGNADGKPLENP